MGVWFFYELFLIVRLHLFYQSDAERVMEIDPDELTMPGCIWRTIGTRHGGVLKMQISRMKGL